MLGYESRFSYYESKEKWVLVGDSQSLPLRCICAGRVWGGLHCSTTSKMAASHTGKLGGSLYWEPHPSTSAM